MLISTSSSASPPTSRDVPCTVGAGPGGFFGANRAIAGGGGIKFRSPSTEAAPALGSTAVEPSAGDDTAHPRCCCCCCCRPPAALTGRSDGIGGGGGIASGAGAAAEEEEEEEEEGTTARRKPRSAEERRTRRFGSLAKKWKKKRRDEEEDEEDESDGRARQRLAQFSRLKYGD